MKNAVGLARLWSQAMQWDRSLKGALSTPSKLTAKRLKPTRYDRETLFTAMAHQRPIVFKDFPAPYGPAILSREAGARQQALIDGLSAISSEERFSVRAGTSDSMLQLTMAELMRRWRSSRAMIGITDLPVRHRETEQIFAASFLDGFNLMPISSEDVRELEMLTAVISKQGKVTDSHSDDISVCNHCFIGSKLWLAWDIFEGLDAGLEDVERTAVRGSARFYMQTFLSLESATWFLVTPGETLFLPGSFTHRVITLEDYIGVGGFYIGLPNILHTLSRWLLKGSIWDEKCPPSTGGNRAEDICRTALAKLREVEASKDAARRWGRPHMAAAIASLRAADDSFDRELVANHKSVSRLVGASAGLDANEPVGA
ncbi:MAG: hypothetical protein AAF899_07985 [Pseudomonadota bacterium]